MAEAVSEGFEGMYAVGCVIRNRGSLKGLYGAKRPDLAAFCQKQGTKYRSMAKMAERAVFVENKADITGGATHFESIDFPRPYWAKEMTITCTIGRHTFYK